MARIPHNEPEPAGEQVDHILERRDKARSKEVDVDTPGSVTNMETHNRPTGDASPVTDLYDNEEDV